VPHGEGNAAIPYLLLLLQASFRNILGHLGRLCRGRHLVQLLLKLGQPATQRSLQT
jgi:hypothetical protein